MGQQRRAQGLTAALFLTVVLQPVRTASDPATSSDKTGTNAEAVSGSSLETAGAAGSKESKLDKVLWAVNCGGDSLVGSRGVVYLADSAINRQASGGTEAFIPVPIRRADTRDYPLYQTERYGTTNFFYDIPTPKQDGRYTIVLNFAEVAFREPNKKIFNVILNEKHTVVRDLDIFSRVGHAAAHDEYVSFTIKNKVLRHRRKSSKVDDTIRLEFVKGHNDNPKVCGVAMVFGNASFAQCLVGVESDEVLKADVGSSGETQGLYPDPDEVDVRKKGRTQKKKDMLKEEEDEHPLPLNSMVLGGLILAVVLVYENYIRMI